MDFASAALDVFSSVFQPSSCRFRLLVDAVQLSREFRVRLAKWVKDRARFRAPCPRLRGYPVAFGYRNCSSANRTVVHGAACSQVFVEVVIKTELVPFSHCVRNFRSGYDRCNDRPRPAIRLAAGTMAGAQIREARVTCAT